MSSKKRFLKALSAVTALTIVTGATSGAVAAIAGDANADGSVGVADIVTLGNYIVGTSDTISADADVTADGRINVFDMIALRRDVLGSEPVTEINYIHLNGATISTEGSNMTLNAAENVVTITASGTYYVDGTLNDGQILVNVADETVDTETVKIFLCGANITGASAPAIFVENAENTSINLQPGTENYLSDGTTAYAGDYLETAVVEAKDDITFKGTGTLNITANTQYAVACNNDVKFTEGTVNIESVLADAVRGKTSVTVKGTAVVNIDSEGDGIKSTKGNVAIEGGTVSVKAGNDAIQAETTIDISGGNVTAGGDRGLTGVTGVNITGGTVIATATDNQTDATLLTATQGTMLLNCSADATNTDGCWKKANTIVVNGKTTFAPVKKYLYALVSDASITNGSTYTLTNGSTGATVKHTNDTASSFAMTGNVTSFETVNMNPGSSSGSDIIVTGENSITLASSGITFTGSGATVSSDGKTVTVTEPGIYSVTGTMDGGQIVVDADKTTYADGVVELDLMGMSLTNTANSPIYVAQVGDEVQIVAKNGYDNTISDGTSYTNADGGMGAIYSCDDLKIKGSGNLTVNGNAGDGIVCKNDLKVYNSNLTVNAADDCIRGKDSVTVGDVDDTDFSSLKLNLTSKAGDGIKSNCQDASTADKTYGLVDINGGTITMNVYGDGVQAAQVLNVNGGTLNIETTGSKDSGSAKGLKGGLTDDETGTTTTGVVNVNGGSIVLKTNDDGINSNGDVNMFGGQTQITVKGTTTGYQGVHADAAVTLGNSSANSYHDMTLVIYQAYEGIEAMNIYQKSGSTIVSSTDDAYNVAGGADNSGSSGGWPGQGGTSSGGAGTLAISGGFSIVSVASGDHDGYDSNGSLSISGGIAVTNGQDAFDCDGGISYTGGVYIKDIGSQMGGMGGMGGGSSMTESVNVSASVSAGTRVTLCDGSGNVIASFIADKSCSSLVAGCTGYSGATFYTGGTLNGSTYFQELDQTQLAAYGGTLSGGTAVSGSGSGNTNPWG